MLCVLYYYSNVAYNETRANFVQPSAFTEIGSITVVLYYYVGTYVKP